MHIIVINPPFKAEYGKFSRESRSPAITKSGALYYPLWLIYAASYSKKCGHKVDFVDAPAKPLNENETLNLVGKLTGSDETILFVLGTSTPSIKSDVAFGAVLKEKYSSSFVLLVGTHPTATAEETLGYNDKIDAIAIGEYDYIVRELADALDANKEISGVRGLCFRKDSEFVRTPPMPPIENMDEIPFASQFIKEYLNERDYFFAAATYPSIQIFTGRGCPCRCNFCVYPQTMHGHKYRARSPENVVAEFEYIANNFADVKEVVIEDDTFTIDKDRLTTICNLLIEKKLPKRLRWLCNARVNTLDLATMKLMKKAGCRLIIPGIESGSQEILNNIKKGTKIEQYLPYVRNAKKAGLLIHACYMVGNQGETKETMQQTLKLALKLNTDTAQFFPLIPYPGTEAYEYNKKMGYLTVGDYEHYCSEDGTHNTVLNLPNLSAQEMVDFCNYARKKYYLRPSYILHRLRVGLTNPDDLKRSIKAFGKLKKYLFK
ncbi:radical SAM protein [Treponema sp.]|uniref:B12-binding domain-containing radical SAM protein n=1 Tax=Treponema sp. TaxID=166 RepID=UPI0025DA0C90|nr:radical SAM protein [Treponema sp.]MBR4320887.1 radical SAM protein [Treponema sp.]